MGYDARYVPVLPTCEYGSDGARAGPCGNYYIPSRTARLPSPSSGLALRNHFPSGRPRAKPPATKGSSSDGAAKKPVRSRSRRAILLPLSRMTVPFFSVVLPVFNEEGVLDQLHRRLTAALEGTGRTHEIIYVDDGSRDGSFAKLKAIHRSDPHVRVIRFSRNFGHHKAITAGMDVARGECVILMDSDLQDQPEEIPKLLAKFDQGFDVVYGVRTGKKHGLLKRVGSFLFVRGMNAIVGEGGSINTHIFRLVRRNVVDVVNSCREHSRFIVGLVSWAGFDQVGVPVEHGARFAGETKYSFFSMIRLALTSMTNFSQLPLQLASWVGFGAAFFAVVFTGWIVARKLIYNTAIEGWTSTMVSIFFLGGVQLLCIGILGEYVGRLFTGVQNRPLYVVATKLGFDRSHENADRN
jgi:glycosyltransferase involved in cell wall biosynthesis